MSLFFFIRKNMLNFQKKQDRAFDLDLTALIDVIFLLLLFFILTAASNPLGLKLNLPKEQGSSVKEKYIQIQIKQSGSFFLNKKQIGKQALAHFLVTVPKTKLILITADKKASYEYVADLLALLEKQKLTRITLETATKQRK